MTSAAFHLAASALSLGILFESIALVLGAKAKPLVFQEDEPDMLSVSLSAVLDLRLEFKPW